MVIRMVVTNVDNKIKSHIQGVSYSDMGREAAIGNIQGYLDAMIELGFINEAEYKNYMGLMWKG